MATRALGNPTSTSSLFTNSGTHFRRLRRNASTTACDSVAQFERSVQTRCQSRDLSVPEALGYLNSLIEMTPMPSIFTLNRLIGSLSSLNRCSAVVSAYTHLARSRSVDFRPDVCTLTIVIKCLSLMGEVRLGFAVLGAAIKSGVGYNSITTNALLDGLCRRRSVAAAADLFERVERDEVAYGTFIDGLCKSGETRMAVELLRRMGPASGPPNLHCLGSVVDRLCKDGSVDEALTLFRSAVTRGAHPNVILYTPMIHGLGRLGRRGEALGLIKEMLEIGISPNVFTFTVLIDLLCKDEDTDEAVGLFREMIRRGVAPDIFCCNSLIDGLSRAGKWVETVRVLEEMRGLGVCPDIVTFGCLLDARFKEGNFFAGLGLVGVLLEKGILLPEDVPFFAGLCRSGRTREAEVLSEIITVEGSIGIVMNTQTMNILLNGLSSCFVMPEARGVFDRMVERGRVNRISFNTVINGYCRRGEMDEAKEVFDRMVEIERIEPNTVTFNTLANGFLSVRRFDEVLGTIKGLVLRGLRPDKVTRSILETVRGYTRGTVAEEVNTML